MKKTLFPPQYDQILDVLRPTQAYLVGGAVRDMLLNRPIYDLDFALPKKTVAVAKRVADQLGGVFFVLDEERETCRVILTGEDQKRLVVDFTLFQGNTIEEDLASRDFTITSMALDIGTDSQLIDLFQGIQDLKDGLIRSTSERSLADDPLRCLRAVRLAAQLRFRILSETKQQIERYHHQMVTVSPERKRDELFRILSGPNQSAAFHSLHLLDLYPYILPGEFSSQGLRNIKNLESLWLLFREEHRQEKAANWSKGLLVHRLGRYRDQIREYLSRELVPGRSFHQLIFLIPLLAGSSKQESDFTPQQIIDQVPLSNQEARYVMNGIQAANNWQRILNNNQVDQALKVYRFFGQFGQAGVAAIFLSLAKELDEQLGDQQQNHWIEHLNHARFFLEGYWERYQEWVDPPLVLDGNDLQRELHIPAGPEIGYLLELLREEQVRSGLRRKQEGFDFLKEYLALQDGRDS